MGGSETGRVQGAPGRFPPPHRRMNMRTRDREHLGAEAGRNLETMLRRMAEWTLKVQKLGVMVPWMPPWETYSGMRRRIARLRAGKVEGLDPQIPPLAMADLMELSLEKEMILRASLADIDGRRDLERRINEKLDSERFRRSVDRFHSLKKSPEASDPDSRAAEKVRQIHRTRKREEGRWRDGKRKG